MGYFVTNIGVGRHFPTCAGNVWLARGDSRYTNNEKLVEELRQYRNLLFEKHIPVREIPRIPPPMKPHEIVGAPAPDYGGLPINTLRMLAASKGLKGCARLPKAQLIQRLNGGK